MPEATFVSEGDRVDYTPSGSAIAVGQVVVIGDVVGVATRAIADGVKGSIAVEGIFAMTKATDSASALTVGAKVYWNDSSNVVTTSSGGNKVAGYVIKAATTSDTTALVKLARA